MMKVLVVTGGIGSGKSAVCRILHEAGVTAQYNADERVKALYSAHPTLLNDIHRKVETADYREIHVPVTSNNVYEIVVVI